MKKQLLIVALFLITVAAHSQQEFNMPWKDSAYPIIIDPYEGNDINFDKMSADTRVIAILHRASKGLKKDNKYSIRKGIALQRGYKWGAYHLGLAGEPAAQADFYLSVVGSDSACLLALDIEGLDTSKYMSLHDAQIFIARVYEKTGRYPLLYCNFSVLTEINRLFSDTSIFSKCGLWYARYRSNIPAFDNKVWNTYTLWQFSCELNCSQTDHCLYNVPGTDRFMDINIFFGSVADLKNRWPDIGKIK